jgi:hypothetical protein
MRSNRSRENLNFSGRCVAAGIVVVAALAALLLPHLIRGPIELVLGLGAPFLAFSAALPAGKSGRLGFALVMTLASWCLLSLLVYLCGVTPSGVSSVVILALMLAGALAYERMTRPGRLRRPRPVSASRPPIGR